MVVSSKYNIGDKVWFISDNKVQQTDITGVSIRISKENPVIVYTLHYGNDISEDRVFAKKEELLKTL